MTNAHDSVERVYRDEADRMWRAVLGYSGNPDVASDAVAEAFAQALARGEEIRSLRPWLWTAVFRIAAGSYDRREVDSHAVDARTTFPEPVVDMVRALARLPERQRLCIVMHDYADRPVAEVAEVLKIARPTVYAHLRQGRRRLRELLEVDDA